MVRVLTLFTDNNEAAYPEEGQVKVIEDLLRCIQPGIPAERKVILLADRGIGMSSALCRMVDHLGWNYLFRVNKNCTIGTQTGRYPIASRVTEGECWHVHVYEHAVSAAGRTASDGTHAGRRRLQGAPGRPGLTGTTHDIST